MTNDSTRMEDMYVRATLGPFDVRLPPKKKHMVGGHLVPNLKGRFLRAQRRRVGIEIMAQHSVDDSLDTSTREWDPFTDKLEDQDRVVLRILKLSRKKEDDEDDSDDDKSVSTMESEDDEEHGKFWRDYKHYRSDEVEFLKEWSKHVELKLGAGNETVVREIRFESDEEGKKFRSLLTKVQSLETERAGRLVALYKKSNSSKAFSSKALTTRGAGLDDMPQTPRSASGVITEGEDINILVEIVSATDVPVADIGGSSDAYVIVRMKGKEIHRTSVINNNLNPIWTLGTGSLFLLQMSPEEFFKASAGMTFVLKDHDVIGSNDMLGSVNVPLDDLLAGEGERTEYGIVLDRKAAKSDKKAKLFLRFKKANVDDIEFMKAFKDKTKKFGMFANECFLPIRKQDKKFMKRQTKKGANGTLHRVRPGPNPDLPEQDTKWLTKQQIHAEALKPSTHWIEAGSGDIGTLFFEIIGCDDLPNMDAATLNLTDKTDTFACVVFEDCIVNSDVIGDTLSPRFMPWCHRAFAFKISHPSSDVLVGIFDHDPEMSPVQLASRATSSVHDAIGRLVINVSNFCPNTEYLLKYPLYYGELAEHRKKTRGSVTLRLRLEFPDLRQSMIKGILPPPPTVVSVARKVDFQVAHYTTDGVVDDAAFSLATLTGYVAELETLEAIVPKLLDAAMFVWLWRGHYNVRIGGKELNLPLHSMTAFTWGILVTWNFNLFPSFFLFSIGWILLACNEHVQQHPSRWHQCPSYYGLMRRILLGSASTETIAAGSVNAAEIDEFNKKAEDYQKRRAKEKQVQEEHEAALQEEMAAEASEADAAEELGGKSGGGLLGNLIPDSPLKPHLYPIQKQLAMVISYLRIAKNIVLWNEAYYSFWIVTACFGAAVVSALVPWAFLLRWILRIVVVAALGPWMMLVDRHYFQTDPNMTNEERDEELRLRMKSRYEEVLTSATDFFIRKERAIKMHSMTKYMFGAHLLRVPRFSEDLYADIPLPSSSCAPIDPASRAPIRVEERKFGQKLSGDMIPLREVQAVSVEKNSHAKKKKGKKTKKHFWNKSAVAVEKTPLLGDSFGNALGYNGTGAGKSD